VSRMSKAVEFAANTAIVVGTVALLANLLWARGNPASGRGPKLGSSVVIGTVDWSRYERTLVLAVRPGCHFCSDSAPFYRRLATEFHNDPRLSIAVWTPTPQSEASQYLAGLGLPSDLRVVTGGFTRTLVPGTPALLLVNTAGSLEGYWLGKLNGDQEAEVLGYLRSTGPTSWWQRLTARLR